MDLSGITTPMQLIGVANDQTSGWFFLGIIIMLFSIFLLTLLNHGFEKALFTSAFVSFILSLLFTYAGLVDWMWVLMFFGILMFSIIYIMTSQPE